MIACITSKLHYTTTKLQTTHQA